MNLPNNNTALRNLSALVDFSNNINSNLNIDFALNNLLLTCFGKLHTTKGIIALYENEILKIKLLKGFKQKDAERIIEIIHINNEENYSALLSDENIKLYQKLISSDQTIGFVFLGGKLSGQLYENEDKMFLSTITQIGSAAIKNIQNFEKLNELNKQLDSKINQLNSLFDLGKEFSSILEIDRVSKLLIFAISAQMLVSKFAIVLIQDDNFKILESKFNTKQLNDLLEDCKCKSFTTSILTSASNDFEEFNKIGIDVVVPMVIKNVTKGFIFLGKRLSKKNYSQSDLEYLSSVASLAIISIENSLLFQQALEKQKIEKDLEIARNIQRNLLPRSLPKSDKFEIEAINKTAKMVGGDFYDVVHLTEKKLLIAIADVSGKGIQASLLMANLQAFLKAIYKQNYKLEEASNFLNDVVSENTTNGSFITFFWGILDTETNEFSYVNMGHNPPLLVDDKGIRKLNKGGMILGVMKTIIPYEMETVKLKTDDVILLFTDGITEAMDFENNEFTDERLETLVLKSFKHNSKMILHNIMEAINNHTINTEQSDDITCLVLKIK